MSNSVRTHSEVGVRVGIDSSADRRRRALTVMLALAGAFALLSLTDFQVGPAWLHWAGSFVALSAALGVVVLTELNWQRAVSMAEAAGLVAPARTPGDEAEAKIRG